MSTRTVHDLTAVVEVLASLTKRFPELPAAEARVSPIFPNHLELSFHDANGLNNFERWRCGLGIAPGLVDRDVAVGGGPLMWLRVTTTVDGVAVELIGYGHVLVERSEDATVPAGSAVPA
ncbi:hypothetical protein [Streptomyces sp. NPDC057682]|uniref:hypothetical protein n=1 Tax=Streptomyces sp. NPDC057682 TaxID=3346210 RepID=UPI0036AEBFD1